MSWQPIETAPKDGSKILACRVTVYQPETVVWASYHPNAQGKECWRTSSVCGDKRQHLTHWMPLPTPPQEAA